MTHRLIIEVLEDGLLIELDDGSRWAIKPGDIGKTAVWYETQRIVVEENDSSVYPYKLKNLDTSTQETVEASRE